MHNIPDFMAFSALTNRWRGTRVLLDIHDLVPEFFCSKFAASERSLLARSLRMMERWSAKAADHVILPLLDKGSLIGPCVGNVVKFMCIGLNYADHAA